MYVDEEACSSYVGVNIIISVLIIFITIIMIVMLIVIRIFMIIMILNAPKLGLATWSMHIQSRQRPDIRLA